MQPKPTNPKPTTIDDHHHVEEEEEIPSPTKPHYFLSPLTLHPRSSCIILTLLLIQLLLLSLSSHLPPLFLPSSPPPSSHQPSFTYTLKPIIQANNISNNNSVTTPTNNNPCEHGRFYIYTLPSEYNIDVFKSCDKLSPWGSRCRALSNSGLGPVAKGISRIIPSNLAHTWYWTDQFSSEVIFHNRLSNHICRTSDPSNATAFYVPFYAGLAAEKYLWSNVKPFDQYCHSMLTWLQGTLPYFNASQGWDHFMVMGRITWDFRRSHDRDWGSSCIYEKSMRNITRLLIERNPWDYFDVGVPYPTGFHPSTTFDVYTWQTHVLTRPRHALFCFAGAKRGLIKHDFRGTLLNQCHEAGEKCRTVDCGGTKCSNGTNDILEMFLDSEFCLQPRGDSFTRRSIFDCMVAGSIPVFFWRRSAYFQYEWFLPGEPESYSVFIHRNEVNNGTLVKSVLEKFSKEEVKRMREKVVEIIPKIVYSKPSEGLGSIKDAVDVAVDGVLRRIKEQQENGFRW